VGDLGECHDASATSRAALIASLALMLLGGACGGDDEAQVDVGLPTKEMSAEDSAFIDAAATDMVEGRLLFVKGELPGLWVGIWDPEKGVHVRAYGKSVIGGRDADADDFVRIASITKTFVATVVLQLVGEGRLRLTDSVEEHLPALVERFPELRGRTVRQLLSMRSGLPNPEDARDSAKRARDPTRRFTPESLVGLALEAPVSPPGTPGYSNTSYILLGEIAEAVTGAPLAELIAKRIAEPLGIEDARLPPDDDTSLPEPSAHGYAFGCDDDLETLGVREGADLTARSVSGVQGAGGMYARFSDLGVWGASMFGNALLPKTLAFERLRVKEISSFAPYGLGVFRFGEMVGPGAWYGHGGSILGWQSFLVHNPQTGSTAAVLATTCGVEIIPRDLLKYLYPR
jgi:D-alanyl-D-alanine carboxypeptidase